MEGQAIFIDAIVNSAEEIQWMKIEKKLINIRKLLYTKLQDQVDDLIINLYIQTSQCCFKTRRLISAENDLNEAINLL